MHLKPKKGLGQNFLIDQNIQNKIVDSCGLSKEDIVLEIGPGRGELSRLLLPKVKRLIAVEIDNQLCKILKDKLILFANLDLINKNILETDIAELYSGQKASIRLKVISNVPYYISTPIISHLIRYRRQISEIYLTLQKELAKRLTAKPRTKDYSAFSCFVQCYTRPKVIFNVPKNSFWPRPKVDSCFIKLDILNKPAVKVKNEDGLFKLIRLAFSQRRKMLKNNLMPMVSLSKLRDCFQRCAININSRAEDLSLEDFARLNNLLTIGGR